MSDAKSIPFYLDAEHNGKQIKNFRFEELPAHPLNPYETKIYRNTTDGFLYEYKNSAWIKLDKVLIDDSSEATDTTYSSSKIAALLSDAILKGTKILGGTNNANNSLSKADGLTGTGAGGDIEAGNMWWITANSTFASGAVNLNNGDIVIALVDNAGDNVNDWVVIEGNIGYTPEDIANKVQDILANSTSTTKYSSVKATYDYIQSIKTVIDQSITDLQTQIDSSGLNLTDLMQRMSDAELNKANKVSGAVNNNFPTLDANGDLKDSGLSLDTDGSFTSNLDTKIPSQKASKTYADTKITKIASPVVNELVLQDTDGNLKKSGKKISTDSDFIANSDNNLPTEKATYTFVQTQISNRLGSYSKTFTQSDYVSGVISILGSDHNLGNYSDMRKISCRVFDTVRKCEARNIHIEYSFDATGTVSVYADPDILTAGYIELTYIA